MTASRRLVVWTGVFAAPAAWALQLVLGYWFEEAACSTASRSFFAHDHAGQITLTAGALAGAYSIVLDPCTSS